MTRYEVFTRRPHAHRYAYRTWCTWTRRRSCRCGSRPTTPRRPGTTAGELLEAYSYTDLKFNVGLGDNAFDY